MSSPVTSSRSNENGTVPQRVETLSSADKDETVQDSKLRYSYQFKEDLSPWTKFKAPIVGEIRFNPVVSFIAIIIIWSFVAWCIILREDVPFIPWRSWIVDHFTWLYIGTQDMCALFMIFIYFSKYSSVKLGKPDEKPEFNNLTWFMMLFACGIGVGLFFYGVAEPVLHYTTRNRYNADPTVPDNTLAQIAINLTLYHWGIHAWILYSLIGLLLCLMSFREDLPMTMKSCFYPIFGDRIFGWIGDVIDILSIITTLFGVCTSLGLGARQLNSGLHTLNSEIPPDDVNIQVITIWCITTVATISTVSGVGAGIRRISEICFVLGNFLMLVSFFLDDTFYLLNLFVQSLGYYVQYLLQLGWHTDAFEQLQPYADAAYGRKIQEGYTSPNGPSNWMDDWTLFYWGWWISWSPFVGMFIAKISRGRTIREYLNGTLTAPVLYSFLWLVIFGGIGIKQERISDFEGYCCPDKENWFLNATELNETAYSRNAIDQPVSNAAGYWACEGDKCGDCANSILSMKERYNETFGDLISEYFYLGSDFGSTSQDRSLSRLSCHSIEQMWFDVMRSYGDVGGFLSVFSLFGIILYFVTSSDSGSLVIDCLSSNGDPEPPKIQRVFWALTEGAAATALLVAGGSKGLEALRTAGIVSGLPYTFVIFLLCIAIWRSLQVAMGELDPFGPQFPIRIFDPLFAEPVKILHKKRRETFQLFIKFLLNIVIAPWTIAIAAHRLGGRKKSIYLYLALTLPFFLLTILLHLAELAAHGCWAIGWCFYILFAICVAGVRIKARHKLNIEGTAFEDFLMSLLFYPSVAVQLDLATEQFQNGDDSDKVEVVVGRENLGMEMKTEYQK